ncbi:unnamed protein product [Bursaphelenchus xylophilus]|uniref:(pine wood nematode) hypothetical protein n=1 Tax=Bursaphelenchus xylophilus TaxID=6326 RepID=A0A1I7RLX1_BURXY|nr:unnamed protein product [Bursaphelenchus xylophilus]CAG9113308.1 unnamed protein product [Bursaphelenchus xylophilus]
MIFWLLILLLALLLFYNFHYKRRNLPPGPTPWPFVGNALTLSRTNRWETKFLEWSRTYGSTFTYWLGELPVVAVCDYADMQQYFVKQADLFSDRYNQHLTRLRFGEYGILMTNGAVWREQRRFALKVLRDFGLGKNQMEERILLELDDVIRKTDRICGPEEIDFFKFTDIAVGSVINSIVNGYRFTEENSHEFYRLKDLTKNLMMATRNWRSNLATNNPWLQRFSFFKSKMDIAINYFNEITAFLNQQVAKHLEKIDYSQDLEPNDLIDAFLLERQRRIAAGNEGSFVIRQLNTVVFDLWLAGQETTSSTLTWIIGYLMRFPEVQEKLQKELDTVIGSKRIVRNSDRADLPYTNAVIMECQRCSNILSQNVARSVHQDVEVNGYLLKKGTTIVPQISVLLQNPKIFAEPEKFNPDRFIDQNGKLRQVEELIPFSLGKRICLGEGMARMELFIFTANLFNQYKFESGKVAPSLQKVTGNSMMMKPYSCVVRRR